jgi:hypothetical protein
VGGSGGTIIVGDKSLIDQLIAHQDKVASFRLGRMLDTIQAYRENENSITRDDEQFLLRCAADIIDR